MKKEIKNLNNYFVSKILTNEFETIEIGSHSTTIKIDNEYEFRLWTASEAKNISCYYMHANFMVLTFTEDQKNEIYKILVIDQEEAKQELEKAERLRQYEDLKTEFEAA